MSEEDVRELLEKWQKRIRAAHKAHYRDASILDKQHKKFGWLVVCLSTLVGTSVFTSLATNHDEVWIKVGTGMLSVAATVLAALQTYLNYPEKRTAHLSASTQLSSLKKQIEETMAVEEDIEKLKVFVHEVRSEWDSVTKTAPLLSDKAFSEEISSELDSNDFEI